MEHFTLYHNGIPEILSACLEAPCMQRLKGVGMNCGCEYTSFPRFAGLRPYSRFDHSVGVGLIVWRFTRDEKQAVAGLLHDVASPVFAHVVDFLHGDYLTQESTEDGTEAIIARDETLTRVLSENGLTVDDVSDYHRYPIADNDSPKLSADRLEYTLGNLLNYRIRTPEEVRAFYDDLSVAVNEAGEAELAFQNASLAADFTLASLVCSKIYVSDEDRYAMQMLSEILRLALDHRVLTKADLMRTEPVVIGKLRSDAETAAAWKRFCAYRTMRSCDAPGRQGQWRRIFAKKRFIDPLIAGVGRVTEYDPRVREETEAFLAEPQTQWIAAEEPQQ